MKAFSAICLLVVMSLQVQAQVSAQTQAPTQVPSIKGVLTKSSVDADSVGCGIVQGRLIYIAKTTSEIRLWPEEENLRLEVPVLEILGKRYPENFQEDQGYNLQVVWAVDPNTVELNSFELQYPGMTWQTDQGQKPQNVEVIAEEGRIVLNVRINSYDYCMGSNRVSLNFKLKASSDQNLLLVGTWIPELIL